MITTDRLILRQWTEADRDAWAALNADPVVMEYFPSVLSREEADRTFNTLHDRIERNGHGFWAAEVRATGEYIGMIGLVDRPEGLPISPCIEIGWRLKRDAWGQGYASEGAQASITFAFETLGRSEVVSFTAVSNQRSYRVMERVHMQRLPATFEHPAVPVGHALREHVLYRQTRQEWLAYRRAIEAGGTLPYGYLPLGRYGNGPDMSDRLLDLIPTGSKRATTSLVWEYDHEQESLPTVGGLELVTDFDDHPRFITRTVAVEVKPFNEVTAEFAFREGEGDRSLEYWRRVHWDFFSRVCEQIGQTPSETMPVVCLQFEVIQTFAS